MAEMAIQFTNVHKYYGRVHALQGLSLDIRAGEVFGFLGPNGAGKTTTIRCLMDLIRPNSGEIRVLGKDAQREALAVRAQVGYLPGDLMLEGDFTPRDFLRYIRRLRGNLRPWQDLMTLAGRLELSLDRKIRTFSQGNKQKVGLLQAFAGDVPLIVLDEPTGGLDPLVQQEVLNIVLEEKERGATVFFSSHILSEVQKIADRVGIIRQGNLVEIATTDSLIHRALSRATIHFAEPIEEAQIGDLANVNILRVNDHQKSYMVEVRGEMDGFIKALAQFPVRELEVGKPSLEEVFMDYYKPSREEA